ncbi:hypothetical protein CYMTET_19105, partial [Cymbomonas tetramitiformis]
ERMEGEGRGAEWQRKGNGFVIWQEFDKMKLEVEKRAHDLQYTYHKAKVQNANETKMQKEQMEMERFRKTLGMGSFKYRWQIHPIGVGHAYKVDIQLMAVPCMLAFPVPGSYELTAKHERDMKLKLHHVKTGHGSQSSCDPIPTTSMLHFRGSSASRMWEYWEYFYCDLN